MPIKKRCDKGSRKSSTNKTCRHKHKKCKDGYHYSKTSNKCNKRKKRR